MSQSETVREYGVVGMSCDHCVLSLSEDIGAVAGVERVTVELANGRMVVTGDASEQAIREAVAEAGYEVGS